MGVDPAVAYSRHPLQLVDERPHGVQLELDAPTNRVRGAGP